MLILLLVLPFDVMKWIINVSETNEELKNPLGFCSSAGPVITILAGRAAAREQQCSHPELRQSAELGCV